MKFNPFLMKYLLSEDIVSHIIQNSNFNTVRFDATANVDNPQEFYSKMSISDQQSYAKFGEEVVRFEADSNVFYVIFRSAKEDRPDIGVGRYTFARPSSVEIGYVDVDDAYVSFYKEHYSTWFGNQELEAPTKDEIKLLTKSIEYGIINAIVDRLNLNAGTNIPLKPVDPDGKALFMPAAPIPAPVSTTAPAPSGVDPLIANVAQQIS